MPPLSTEVKPDLDLRGAPSVTRHGRFFRLVFSSELVVPPESRNDTIRTIVHVSRRANADLAITGALLVWQDYIVQTLEGHEDAVLGLYAKIARDDRHDAVTVLAMQHVRARLFTRWSTARPLP